MITIGLPYTYIENGKAYLTAPIHISEDTIQAYCSLENKMRKTWWRVGENYPPAEWDEKGAALWFSVDESYAQYLCYETADAFVCAMLWYAMTTGSDIVSEAPVSEKLLFSVNQYLIPALCTEKNGYKRITVTGKAVVPSFNQGTGVGTGMSCGIDSLYTLRKYLDITPEKWRITHLAYFNMGAIFHPDSSKKIRYSIAEFYQKTDEMSLEKLQMAAEVAEEVGLPIVYICSNMDKDFYRGAYGYTAVYRNCACVLALQKLYCTYYCSSAGWPDYFDLSLSEGSEHYESLLCHCLSTEKCSFILSDYVTRIEKTTEIADWGVAQRHLDVCFNFNNCGHCAKCKRTLLTLDLLGSVDQYGKVFDINDYKARRSEIYAWLLNTKKGDANDDNTVFAKEIYDLLKSKNIHFPIATYCLYCKMRLNGCKKKCKSLALRGKHKLKIAASKIYRKVMR